MFICVNRSDLAALDAPLDDAVSRIAVQGSHPTLCLDSDASMLTDHWCRLSESSC